MDMTNCPRCGKLFARMSSSICPDCEKSEEETFNKVRQFLEEYPESTLDEVARACGVTPKKIMSYIRDGRLEATSGMGKAVVCAKCGRPITRGRFCEKCIVAFGNDANALFSKTKSTGTGMHTFRKGDK